jgi:ATP-dependent DNA helicase RecQ
LLPAALLPRPTLIIYPLLALMSDQKRRMDGAGLDAVVFRGGQEASERDENFRRIQQGAKIILANPEVLQSDALVERLSRAGIIHAVIDEAHCVAEWGDSFRPAYLTLGNILTRLGVPVITAFTATASPQVLARAAEVLFGGDAHIVRSDSDRQNICYYVERAVVKNKTAHLLASREEKPMIVFCGTRAKSEETARLFAMYFGNDRVRFYHAGLEKHEKNLVEKWFFPKTDAILCSTCAFGMGVDKPDVRTVIHLEAPSSAEAYIQEAGRGGRDGSLAKAILVWSDEDEKKFAALERTSRARVMFDFAQNNACRRQTLLDALGAEQAACAGCDVCEGAAQNEARETALARSFFGRHTLSAQRAPEALAAFLNQKLIPTELTARVWERADADALIENLLERGALAAREFGGEKLIAPAARRPGIYL